jgi:hypothetical protein
MLSQENFELKVFFWKTIFNYIKTKKSKLLIDLFFTIQEKWNLNYNEFILQINTVFPSSFTTIQIEELKKELQLTADSKKENLENDGNRDNSKPIETTLNLEINHDEKQFEKISEKNEKTHDEISETRQINSIDHSFYVENAGLILLHPFIKELFRNCNLLDEKGNINDKELTIHLLHFAATKKEQDYEHSMLFEKFLCGIPLHQSIKREVVLSEFNKATVEELLEAVVSHWSALKSSSTAILRSEFLQREGKLDLSDDNPKLFIERKTQDILLDRIPWNINIIKIPWVDKLIYTQW